MHVPMPGFRTGKVRWSNGGLAHGFMMTQATKSGARIMSLFAGMTGSAPVLLKVRPI